MTLECKNCSMNKICICNPSFDECQVRKEAYKQAINDFYDKILNFEDYIDFVEENNGILLYSGVDFSETVVKIKNELFK